MRDPISIDTIDLGPELFASADVRVINYNGDNYYKTCGVIVRESATEGSTTCILPENHWYGEHQDFEGNARTMMQLTSYDDLVRSSFLTVLRRTGLDDTQIYNAMNALQQAGLKLSVNKEA